LKKGLPIIIAIVVVVVVGVLAWMFLGKGEISMPVPGAEIKKEAGEAGGEFVGKIKDAVALGTPMKCTYTQGNTSGTSYIQGKKMYGEITAQGKQSFVIIKDNCLWSWSQGEVQGFKTCFEEDFWETGGEATGEGQASIPTDTEYRCAPAVFADSKFDPPANVNFMTMEEMMQGATGE
jgi:FlaG/FlaF family flagellin (archaellin)